MIHRLVCLLLVPGMLVSQCVSLTHSHAGSDVTEPEDHSSRPHFHTHGHSHTHHDLGHNHQESVGHSHDGNSNCEHASGDQEVHLPTAIASKDNHDADAAYLSDVVDLSRGKRGKDAINVGSPTCVSISRRRLIVGGSAGASPRFGQPQSVFDASCPTYLRTLSLRL